MNTMDHITIDSCHSRWIFDTKHKCFCRVLKGPGFEKRTVTTEWRPYHELMLDPESDSFTVVLDPAGTRMLRSWRHTWVTCPLCGGTGTEELSLQDIAQVASG